MSDIRDIAEKVYAGERLTFADGMRLYRHHNLIELSALADFVRRKKHPENIVTYVIGRNINYTNVCWVKCDFCAFYRPPGHAEGYTLPKEVILRKCQELVDVGASLPGGNPPKSCEVLMQGGLNPKLKIEYYEDLLSSIRDRFPEIHLHSLSATEIIYIAHISRLSIEECLKRLRAAGLDSIPGAGAEILVDEPRSELAFRKDTTDEWLDVHRTAHRLGMNTTATMMFGSVEKPEHRIEHILRVREVQDEALKGKWGNGAMGQWNGDDPLHLPLSKGESPRGSQPSTTNPQPSGRFTAFILWNFQPHETVLGERLMKQGWRKATGYEYLRMTAVARLLLDNIDNLQASWVTQGAKIAQISLKYGNNDFGSLMMEENVVSAAGTKFCMPLEEIHRLIRDAGYTPVRRNTRYELIDADAGEPSSVTPQRKELELMRL
ncbi:MAG: dehypoxanthine futalosine cyclase [Abditibacteriales bacterium]|nr:dehypoxanthine futalosine cyclase [Abditibacteriales bacterium]MDW8364543.1 cyclic dehypoxanthinyl futalosine synthase [Abditibacteriales bacterium]